MNTEYERLGNGAKKVKFIHKQRLMSALYKDDYSVIELAKLIGVSHPTTKTIVEEFAELKLIKRSEKFWTKSVGRPMVKYTINAKHGVFACINFERYESSYYIFDFSMKELARRKLKMSEYNIDDINGIINDIKTDLLLVGLPLLSVSIAMVGQVNDKQEVILSSLFDQHLKNFPFRKYFAEQLNCPVVLDNDTRIASIGDLHEGDLKGYSNFLYIALSAGISSTIYNNGQQIIGDANLAGEIALYLTDTGVTLHNACSVKALIKRLKPHLKEATIEGLVEGFKTNETVKQVICESGFILGKSIRNMSYITGVKTVALVGTINKFPDEYFEFVKKGTEIVYEIHPDYLGRYEINLVRSTSDNPVKLGLGYLARTTYMNTISTEEN